MELPTTPTVSVPTLVTVTPIFSRADVHTNGSSFCKLALSIPIEGITETIFMVLDKVVVDIEKKIDGTKNSLYGIKIGPYPTNLLKFSNDSKKSVSILTYIISRIFAVLSTEPNSSLSETEKKLETTILTTFKNEKIEFITFRDIGITKTDLSSIDQRAEITKTFTPSQERPTTVSRGNLGFDGEFFGENRIALYYDINIQEENLNTLRSTLTSLLVPVKSEEPEKTKNESRTIMSFKQFSTKLLPESVVLELVKSIEDTIKERLRTIKYNTSTETHFTPPIKVELPIKWDSIK